MSRNFLDKKLPGCVLKEYLELNEERRREGGEPVPRERCEPRHCEYASAAVHPDDSVCEIVQRRISDMAACPRSTREAEGPVAESPERPQAQGSLLDNKLWTKTTKG